jgi:L-lactate dehydrogenase (cytochrome)
MSTQRSDEAHVAHAAPSATRAAPKLSARSRALRRVFALDDFAPLARKRLPRQLYSYISNGAEEEQTILRNREVFRAFEFTPRVLKPVFERDQSIELFGKKYRAPFGISPVGIAAMWCYRGDIVLAQTAQDCGVPAIMSGASLIRMEEVAALAPDTWFQAYMPGDEPRIVALLERIRRAGFEHLVLTVDLPVSVNPEHYARNGFSTPLRPSARLAFDGLTHPRWLIQTFLQTFARHGMPHFENWRAERGEPILSPSVNRDYATRDHLSWEHFRIVRKFWTGPLILKGIMHPDDAAIAANCGADGIIVSNHGGRQLDGAASPIDVLPQIADAVPNTVVMMDSGIRRGTDVLKALSQGARCVFNGRSFNYAATVAGAEGVRHAIGLLRAEVDRDMAHLGINRVEEADATVIRRRRA